VVAMVASGRGRAAARSPWHGQSQRPRVSARRTSTRTNRGACCSTMTMYANVHARTHARTVFLPVASTIHRAHAHRTASSPHLFQVHTFDYVTMAIVKVVKTVTRKKAHRICVQAHTMGTATVTTTWKQMAKQMCLKLQKFGLTSSIAPDA